MATGVTGRRYLARTVLPEADELMGSENIGS